MFNTVLFFFSFCLQPIDLRSPWDVINLYPFLLHNGEASQLMGNNQYPQIDRDGQASVELSRACTVGACFDVLESIRPLSTCRRGL